MPFEHYFLKVMVDLAMTKVTDAFIEAEYTLIYDAWRVNCPPNVVSMAIYNSFYHPEYDLEVNL